MSRYYVFTQEQLEEALRAWLHLDGDLHSCATDGKAIRDFLTSPIAVAKGMCRDLPELVAPIMAVDHQLGEEQPL